MERPKQDDIIEWASSTTTRWAIFRMQEAQKELSEKLATGVTLASETGLTAQLTARLVGEIAGVGAFKTMVDEEVSGDS